MEHPRKSGSALAAAALGSQRAKARSPLAFPAVAAHAAGGDCTFRPSQQCAAWCVREEDEQSRRVAEDAGRGVEQRERVTAATDDERDRRELHVTAACGEIAKKKRSSGAGV